MKIDGFVLACSSGAAELSNALELPAAVWEEDSLITPFFPPGLCRAPKRTSLNPTQQPLGILRFHSTSQSAEWPQKSHTITARGYF